MSEMVCYMNRAGSSVPAVQRQWHLLHGILPELTSPLPMVRHGLPNQTQGNMHRFPHTLIHLSWSLEATTTAASETSSASTTKSTTTAASETSSAKSTATTSSESTASKATVPSGAT